MYPAYQYIAGVVSIALSEYIRPLNCSLSSNDEGDILVKRLKPRRHTAVTHVLTGPERPGQ